MADDKEQLALEQKYFDTAWEERERSRALLKQAPNAAAGSQAATRGVRRAIEARLDSIPGPDTPVAVGRFDLDVEDPRYVGRHAILNEERDVLVVNWQAPAAQPFYTATIDEPQGVTLIRKFETVRNQIRTFEDTLLADLADRVDELTADQKRGVDDALLRDLEADRTGEMSDIVQTIHASQYDLIRRPLDELLVIQGGPGTGKTAVALHRASWLLFNHRDVVDPGDFLVIGPSRTFARYIQKVLPGLGNEGVAQTDVRSLGPQTSDGRHETLEVARLKASRRMVGLLGRALHARVRFPDRTDALPVGRVTLTRAEVMTQLDILRRSPTYSAGRTGMREWIGRAANRRVGGAVPLETTVIEQALERVWPSLTPQAFLQDLLGSRARLTAAGGDDFTAADIERLYRSAADSLGSEIWSDTDVALLDEADSLINGRSETYTHIIMDEAQDLTPMQLRSVRRRSVAGSYTVVGDLAQSTGAWSRSSWVEVIEALRGEHPHHLEELRLGYRVPRQITDLADRLLPVIAPELQPATVVRRGPVEPHVVTVTSQDVIDRAADEASRYAGLGHFTGVICALSDHDAVADALRDRAIHFTDAGDGQLSNSINLLTAEQAKGLEFDAVVVIEPAAIARSDLTGPRQLYIALTRTTRALTIVHSQRYDLLGLTDGEPDQSASEGLSSQSPTIAAEARIPVLTEGGERDDDIRDQAVPAPSPMPAGGSMRDRMIRSAAQIFADEVRGSLPEDAWPALIRQLTKELGISTDRPGPPET